MFNNFDNNPNKDNFLAWLNTREKKGKILRSNPCPYMGTLYITFNPVDYVDLEGNINVEDKEMTSSIKIEFQSKGFKFGREPAKGREWGFKELEEYFLVNEFRETFKRLIYVIPGVDLSQILKIIPSFEDEKVFKLSENIKNLFTIEIRYCMFRDFYTLFPPYIVTRLVYKLGF